MANWIPVSVEAYLEQEATALYRNEYEDGLILAMAGNTPEHIQIVTNLVVYLHSKIDPRRCRVGSSDGLVRASQSRFYYPDIFVVCGERRYDKRSGTAVLLNPNVVIEVLSPSTEKRDRREKRLTYMQHPTITDILLIAQDEVYVEHSARDEQGQWHTNTYTAPTDKVEFRILGSSLLLEQIYEYVFDDGDLEE